MTHLFMPTFSAWKPTGQKEVSSFLDHTKSDTGCKGEGRSRWGKKIIISKEEIRIVFVETFSNNQSLPPPPLVIEKAEFG